ncbi:MAG: phosphate ABC transporter permease subunit PstC [Puniceicoccales bacterium]|jgi:phosphate transport system permease protein|nr:phosphate ABC transporter permease subunit PstC [Puniceicoccales bacterium]
MNQDKTIRSFFACNAFLVVLSLLLIMLFLFREGVPFFAKYHDSRSLYRSAGLEFVEHLRDAERRHEQLCGKLVQLRSKLAAALSGSPNARERLTAFDAFDNAFSEAADPLRDLAERLSSQSLATRAAVASATVSGRANAPAGTSAATWARAALPEVRNILAALAAQRAHLVEMRPRGLSAETDAALNAFAHAVEQDRTALAETAAAMAAWDPSAPVSAFSTAAAFFFGGEWRTASFWQDYYGILPLFSGSLLVCAVALSLAVPIGVAAAVHISQVAGRRERSLVKPAIEFIAATPSVVLGFFGISVLGGTLRDISHSPWLSWVPGCPFSERLNALTAGCLLALVATPTIFTLAEDALGNVSESCKDASLALGASRLQTIVRVVIPSALPGIVSACLLGFGRVIGETMIVLLCAGNRVAIPDFSVGAGVITQPVHTMTGIIAQEMGEVAHGGIHYRALFLVGAVLFCLTMLINLIVQHVTRGRVSPVH